MRGGQERHMFSNASMMLSAVLMILALSMGAALAPGATGSTSGLRPVGHRNLAFAPALSLGAHPMVFHGQQPSAWAPGMRSTSALPPGRRGMPLLAAPPAGAARMQHTSFDMQRAAPRPGSVLPRAGRIGSRGGLSRRVGRAVPLDMSTSGGDEGDKMTVSGFFAKLCRSVPPPHSPVQALEISTAPAVTLGWSHLATLSVKKVRISAGLVL